MSVGKRGSVIHLTKSPHRCLVTNSYLGGSWWAVAPRAYKRFIFSGSRFCPLFSCIWVNKTLKCQKNPSFRHLGGVSTLQGACNFLPVVEGPRWLAPRPCRPPRVPALILDA